MCPLCSDDWPQNSTVRCNQSEVCGAHLHFVEHSRLRKCAHSSPALPVISEYVARVPHLLRDCMQQAVMPELRPVTHLPPVPLPAVKSLRTNDTTDKKALVRTLVDNTHCIGLCCVISCHARAAGHISTAYSINATAAAVLRIKCVVVLTLPGS